jgi:hypothetical protein
MATAQKYTQILNISRSGDAFRAIDKKGESNKPAKLNLLFIYDSICTIYLKDVPLKTIWMSHIDIKNSFNPLSIIKNKVLSLGK